uniref:CSON013237 protein n=1 Tax=Culicoides sonorensis TaxID=179676 RepID=A0A336LMW6_CULSO
MLTWILGLFTFILILWKFSSKKIKFFEDHGISSLSSIPFFGSMWKPFLTQQPYPEWMLENTHKFRKNHFYGLSNFGQITFMIQDPDIIKQICIKEFDNFTNHPNVTITHHDKLLFNSLSNLQDERWKDMRSILSPAFTGSKMRLMFDLIRECASDFVSYCIENLTEDEKFEINSKEIFSKVTMDVISTVAFGLKVDSLRDPENEVYKKATNAFDIQTAVGQFKLLLLQMCPKLGNKLGLTMTKKEFNEFFIQMISESLDHRRNTKSFRPDIIQLLIQAQDGSLSGQNSDLKEGSKKFLTDLELISQCFIFYFAGFETTAALLNFAAYELALNDDVQERLFNEIQETKAKLQGEKITYVILQEMQYLDAFISEVLRVYPPGFITDRLCNHKTEIKDFNDIGADKVQGRLRTRTKALSPLIYLLWKYLNKNLDYFSDRGIPHDKPLPICGNMLSVYFLGKSFPDMLQTISNKFRPHRIYGMYDMHNPMYVIDDPILAKQISIKDFDHFVNHVPFWSDGDDLIKNSLFALNNEKWKTMRSTLSPAFTSSKMKMMFDLIRNCANSFVKYCNENLDKDGRFEINVKDTFSRSTVDVISTCAFGLEVDSLKNPKNDVYINARKAFNFEGLVVQMKFALITLAPKLASSLKIALTPKDSEQFFKKIVSDTINHRRSTNTFRPDVIQLLIQAIDGNLKHDSDSNKSGEKEEEGFSVVQENLSELNHKTMHRNWSDIEITAQCFLFFVAGFDTTSTTLTFATYEMAVAPDIQDKLYDEVKSVKAALGGNPVTYEAIHKMQYLDAFISEVLRHHPPGFITDRSRFALMEIKTLIYHILSEFSIEVCDKTLVPMRYGQSLALAPERDLYVQLKKRSVQIFTSLEMDFITWFCLISPLILIFYFYVRHKYSYFKNRNVPYIKPTPLIGNMFLPVLMGDSIVESFVKISSEFRNEPYIGNFDFLNPSLIIQDPEIIKQIGIKNFDNLSITLHLRIVFQMNY